MLGTDHPFFPPLEQDQKEWHSVNANYSAISTTFKDDKLAAEGVLGGNAARILKLNI